MWRFHRRWPGRIAVVALALAAACSDSPQGGRAGMPAPPAASAPRPGGSAVTTPSRKVTTNLVSLRIPDNWRAESTGSGDVFGPTVHVWRGYAIGRLNVMPFKGSIDDLAPQYCAGHGSVPAGARIPAAVKVEEQGFAPVGDRTAEFRRWTAACAAGPESHRAWYLPVTGLLFWETCEDARIGPMVTTAAVTTSPLAPVAGNPPPSSIPQNCDDTDLTDITTGR